MQARVATRMFGDADINGSNGQLNGAIYVVFVAVTQWKY